MKQDITLIDLDLPSPRGRAPLRRPHSIRRTSSIDVSWPEGPRSDMRFHGRGRDIYTGRQSKEPRLIQSDELFAVLSSDRTIRAIRSAPPRPAIEGLIGIRGGGNLRGALNEVLPREREAGSPLYLLIDDIAGASLVSNWALLASGEVPVPHLDDAQRQAHMDRLEGVCIGFRPGSSALDLKRDMIKSQKTADVEPLHHPDDPEGWHDLEYGNQLSFRRARRIDVWVEDDIVIDAHFQDSAPRRDGSRRAVHEYSLQVTADRTHLNIKTISATPHVLPFNECPDAIGNVSAIVGRSLADMRSAVLEVFPKTLGCTHLNDCMRAIAEVPVMVDHLMTAEQGHGPT